MSLIKTTSIEAEFNNEPARSVDSIDIDKLKEKAEKTKRKRFRLCLHDNTDHLTQEMIICLKGFNYFSPHKHPETRSESYHLIEGALDVYLFNDTGDVTKIIKLAAPNFKSKELRSIMYRLSSPIFHLIIPLTEWTIYHEVATGPFVKNQAVEYASFAPKDNCSREEALKYCNELTNLKLI